MKMTQTELSKLYNNNETIVFNYKRAFEVRWSHGCKEYTLVQVRRVFEGLPYTKRGRYIAMNPKQANNVMQGY